MMILFWWLLVGHALADYPLQGDFLAKAKNHRAPLPNTPWFTCLLAHALIQGGMVAFVTGHVSLGIAEFVAHTIIDYGKSDGWYDFNIDQLLHIICKLLWCALLFSVGTFGP